MTINTLNDTNIKQGSRTLTDGSSSRRREREKKSVLNSQTAYILEVLKLPDPKTM